MDGQAGRSPAQKLEGLRLEAIDKRYAKLRLVRPELLEQVRRSVERHGLLHPLVVNATAQGAHVLLDGFKRLAALEQLEAGEAPCRVVRVEEAAAQAALITYNRPHRGLCELEQAWVVRSLVRTMGQSQTQVAQLLGRHNCAIPDRKCRVVPDCRVVLRPRRFVCQSLEDGPAHRVRRAVPAAA